MLAAGFGLVLVAGLGLVLAAGSEWETAGGVWIAIDDGFKQSCMEEILRRFVWGLTRSTPGWGRRISGCWVVARWRLAGGK